MPVRVCAYCGTRFPGSSRAKYCNRDCYVKSCRMDADAKKKTVPVEVVPADACPFNIGVDCAKQEGCDGCRWNPQVAEQRLVRILARMMDVEVKTDGC